jgi:hypothetical protein
MAGEQLGAEDGGLHGGVVLHQVARGILGLGLEDHDSEPRRVGVQCPSGEKDDALFRQAPKVVEMLGDDAVFIGGAFDQEPLSDRPNSVQVPQRHPPSPFLSTSWAPDVGKRTTRRVAIHEAGLWPRAAFQ